MIGASGWIGRDSRRKNGYSNALLEDGIVVSHALVFGRMARDLSILRGSSPPPHSKRQPGSNLYRIQKQVIPINATSIMI